MRFSPSCSGISQIFLSLTFLVRHFATRICYLYYLKKNWIAFHERLTIDTHAHTYIHIRFGCSYTKLPTIFVRIGFQRCLIIFKRGSSTAATILILTAFDLLKKIGWRFATSGWVNSRTVFWIVSSLNHRKKYSRVIFNLSGTIPDHAVPNSYSYLKLLMLQSNASSSCVQYVRLNS